MRGVDEQLPGPRRSPAEVVGDRVARDRLAQKPLHLGMDRLHPQLAVRGSQDRDDRIADRACRMATVGPAESGMGVVLPLLVRASFRETLEEVPDRVVRKTSTQGHFRCRSRHNDFPAIPDFRYTGRPSGRSLVDRSSLRHAARMVLRVADLGEERPEVFDRGSQGDLW